MKGTEQEHHHKHHHHERKCRKCGCDKVSIKVKEPNPVFCGEDCIIAYYTPDQDLSNLTTLNIQDEVRSNTEPLKLLYTDSTLQFGIENVPIKGNITKEKHPSQTQCIMVVQGSARVIIYDPTNEQEAHRYELVHGEDDTIFIPANTFHQVENTSNDEVLKFLTFYAPPVHESK
jgi:mannose-6-phosphate isomerase-like protein (cupin superfamily)